MSVVTTQMHGDIAVVTIDNPPVNAASQAVRQGLMNALMATEKSKPAAVVLTCAGRTFVAGADIREFDKPFLEPGLPELLNAIESATRPWIAAIHGTALGGGCELALACSHRIGAATAKIGLPEVNLGLIPGAGGTVRLPRLIDPIDAARLAITGKPIGAREATKLGLFDAIAEGDLLEAAVELAKDAADKPMRAPLLTRAAPEVDQATWDAAISKLTAKARGQNSPHEAAAAVRDALDHDGPAALKLERERFMRLKGSPQSAALRYIFFAERTVGKSPRTKGVAPRPLAQIGIIGGGTMGAGIAAAALLSGLKVQMIERNQDAANAGAARVEGILGGSLKRGLITEAKHDALHANFEAASDYAELGEADLVIEAVFEDMDVKKEVFAALEAACKPEAVLATNTSYLDINEIAASVKDPSRVVGLHFFSPAHIMKLLEIVVPEALADDVLATAIQFAKIVRKLPVLAGVCDGFIANRIMSSYRREADYLLEDGALPYEVDAAMRNFGMPMGIFEMQDLAGLDIGWAARKRRAATRPASERYVDIPDRICKQGNFGRKTGRGWYLYDDGKPTRDPEVEALIISESARKGITRKKFTEEELMARILGCMQNEGAAILSEGIAASREDIDVTMVNAFGFPRWKGGPMFMKGA
ncbi:3-hydroxyacyl-CoA dehydrogenase NAD-binding domain-containing protein [Lentibacter sp. XHP0401]|uniref:3-hydroxyacyl-CoA dehydrogenase NAD-binding domain-containing protein n=1 Tax=Lentibacter sp. XHP0401 TaxID=2984334 RepID=UPI0021E74169|nr:3-hydroxyacyl-CoA dehydrogenase NAD-binding domain-containing protein [Lentibacter sp. XHP0401]MCV2893406.1 3-hydroxyacyl-CoA dehydrogenase NAD-binding domain-containing protein [Lentibacter sp. XHP0401]